MMSRVLGKEGCVEQISTAEFLNFIDDHGWFSEQHGTESIFWRDETSSSSSSENFKCFLRNLIKKCTDWCLDSYLVQFWAPTLVGGKCNNLKTSDQPFAIGDDFSSTEGYCSYRKYCMNSGLEVYVGDGAKEEQLGPIGRVFRNQQPESSPDLRLYSAAEHPFRDQAAICGFKGYLALPVFDLLQNQVLGVLEYLSYYDFGIGIRYIVRLLSEALKAANLRTTYHGYVSQPIFRNPQQPQRDQFIEMLETTKYAVPQLHLAQVWVPCKQKQCSNKGNNLSCMERVAFMDPASIYINDIPHDDTMVAFIYCSELHNVQSQKGVAGIAWSSTNKSCFCRNISDLSITEYPLAHYARQARLSFCFAIHLQSVHNRGEFCILEFFLQCPQTRKDVSAQSVLHLLFQIISEKLPSYKIASGQQLPQELAVKVGTEKEFASSELRQPTKWSPNMIVSTMIGYGKSDATFNSTLEPDRLCSLELSDGDTIYWERKELLDGIEEDIKLPLEKIMINHEYLTGVVHFWALKRNGDSCYLKTRGQPLGLDVKKSRFYREQCMKHKYFVGEGAKEEEIGPPGRVFRNRFPEFTPDLRLYSTGQFPLRDAAAHCGLRIYLALPIFGNEQCIGVLEFIGSFGASRFCCSIFRYLTYSQEKKRSLKLTHIHDDRSRPQWRWSSNEKTALTEIERMLNVVGKAPELCLTQLWVPCSQCYATNDNPSCLEQVFTTYENYEWRNFPFCKVQLGKGIAGTVLAAENKSCLFPSLCDFSIVEEPRAHTAELLRFNVCFVVSLQSAYTDNDQYIIEFFLDPSCRNYEKFRHFLRFLLSVMKDELKSFQFASGNQIGDELLVEVIKFGEDSELFTPFESHQPVDEFPFRFNIISHQVGQETEDQHTSEEMGHQDDQKTEHHIGQQIEHLHTSEEMEYQAALETDDQNAYAETEHQHTSKEMEHQDDQETEHQQTSKEMEHQDDQETEHQHTFEEMEHQDDQETEQQDTSDKMEQQVDSGINTLESTKESGKGRNKTSFSISYEVLEQYFGKKIDDVIKELGVSRSTFKRIISSQGIMRWPSNAKNRKNPSIFEASNANKRVRGNQQETLVSSHPKHIELPKTDDAVIIKATFGDDTVKIQFCKSSKMEKLVEEVVRRFNLAVGSFKLKYVDEDDERMLLACDDDLKLCIETLTALGKTPIQVSVQSI